MRLLARRFSRQTLFPDRFLHATPASLGLAAEEVTFWSRDGLALRGWLIPGTRRGIVVFCSGNSGNVSAHLEYVRLAARTGCTVLCFDYRGFGRSDGEADLTRLVDDVEAACELARHLRGDEPLALFGISLGAQAALLAAGSAAGVAAVAVEGVADLGAMLEGVLREGSFGPRRICWLPEAGGALRAREAARLTRLRLPAPLSRWVARLGAALYPFAGKDLRRLGAALGTRPVLIIHGVEDRLLPFESAIDLYDLAAGPRRLWLIPGVGHAQEPAVACGLEYSDRLATFLDAAFAGKPLATPPMDVRCALEPEEPAASGGMRVRVRVRRDAGQSGGLPVLLSIWGGGVLRQETLPAGCDLQIELPGPVEGIACLEAWGGGTDPVAERHASGGYRALFRQMAEAVNARDAAALDLALEGHLRLERALPFDGLAALYCLRAAAAARGEVPGYGPPDAGAERRALERLAALYAAHPGLPGKEEARSPAAWAHRLLEGAAA